MSEMLRAEAEAFLERVEMEPTSGCWLWMGSRDDEGYGGAMYGPKGARKGIGAHRLAYLIWRGPIGPNCGVYHHCDTPPCVRPAHLFSGPSVENFYDMLRKHRHPFFNLNPDLARLIWAEHHQTALGAAELARKYELRETVVRRFLAGRTWRRHLGLPLLQVQGRPPLPDVC